MSSKLNLNEVLPLLAAMPCTPVLILQVCIFLMCWQRLSFEKSITRQPNMTFLMTHLNLWSGIRFSREVLNICSHAIMRCSSLLHITLPTTSNLTSSYKPTTNRSTSCWAWLDSENSDNCCSGRMWFDMSKPGGGAYPAKFQLKTAKFTHLVDSYLFFSLSITIWIWFCIPYGFYVTCRFKSSLMHSFLSWSVTELAKARCTPVIAC